jgi:hypothetical protein
VARSYNICTSSFVLTDILFHSKRALLWRFDVAGDDKMYLGLHVNCPVFVPEISQHSFTDIRAVGAALIHADLTKLIGAFHVYANAPKNRARILGRKAHALMSMPDKQCY